jgi:ABC-type transport system involved in multi-copper enzyme maturation permease subunit
VDRESRIEKTTIRDSRSTIYGLRNRNMTSKAITHEPDTHSDGDWHSRTEAAPSVVRTDDPMVARAIGLVGAVLVIVFGGAPQLLTLTGRASPIGPGLASFSLALGVACLLFHAAFDWDVQFRRVYMAFGYVVVIVGAILAVVAYPNKMGDQFGKAAPCLLLGLLFLLAFLRNETDARLRRMTLNALGIAGAIQAIIGLVGGNIKGEFLTPIGLLLAILGVIYLTAYVSGIGTNDERGYRVGLGIGGVGLLVFLVALGRSILPSLFFRWHWTQNQPADFLVPQGLLLMALGVLYVCISLLLCSDRSWIVLTRRELGSMFYSPIAYIVLFVFVIAHWWAYFWVMSGMLLSEGPSPEPIVSTFILQWSAVISTVVVIPVLTMRLLSEEKRSGTLEVLLTAPVDETAVVVSKFLAAFVMYLTLWAPFGLFLVYLRVGGESDFDYRPLFSFAIGLAATTAAFISMGVFFSSLTRSQVASGVLTFAGMLSLTLLFLVSGLLRNFMASSAWVTVLKHLSYIDVWIDTLDGRLLPRQLIFFVSMTVVWLFLSVKVLEARKWT